MKQFVFTVACLALVAPTTALAQGQLYNPLGVTSVPVLVGRVIQALLGVVGAIALVMVIYGGFLWLTSGGNPEKITKGRVTLLWAVIGLAVIFGSYALSNFVITQLAGIAAGS